MQIGGTDVDVMVRIAVKHPCRKTVDNNPQRCQCHNPRRRHRLRLDEAVDRLDDQIDRYRYQHRRVEQSRQNFGPLESERLLQVLGAVGELVRVIADNKAHHVAEVMKRIAEQRQRTRENPPDELRYGDDEIEDDTKEELSSADVMMMMVVVFHKLDPKIKLRKFIIKFFQKLLTTY